MNLPSVSICTGTYQRAHLVSDAIDSVLGQDYAGTIEIVVVDDGSTDGTVDLLKEKYGDKIMLLTNDRNRGIGYTCKRAISAGRGDIRGILDSDDWYTESFVRRCVETLLENPEIGLVYTDNIMIGDSPDPMYCQAIEWDLGRFLETCNIRGDCWLAWWSALSRTALHDERLHVEVDYDLYHAMSRVTQFKRIPEYLHYFRCHKGRTTFAADRSHTAYYHAACLAKWGHSISYAFMRADRFDSREKWRQKIEQGYEFGLTLRTSGRVA